MATLSQVYTNLGFGCFVATMSCFAFGMAVQFERNKDLTPRAWARPVNIVKNVLSRPYGLGWIWWSVSLKDIDLLSGIPGTGTRNEGWSGPNLRTNLDAVLMMRYNKLQCKVTILATILCTALLLPLYKTTPCDPLQSGEKLCEDFYNHTEFEELTFANVPPHRQLIMDETLPPESSDIENKTLGDINPIEVIMTYEIQWIPGITERYLAYTVTIALISLYTCYLLWYEWIESLALRRVYYLESEYYEERLDELDEIRNNSDPEDPFQEKRPPFLPHPEMRETLPNVSLHSVLYKLPSDLATKLSYTAGNKDDDKSILKRQLEAAVDFFDQCIPTQPGFTSSVVAVTMVPDATKITKVWGQWYRCGAAMRRLRYIQAHLECRRRMQQIGRKGLHDFFVVAPAHVAGVVLKATTETVGHIRDHAAERIETVSDRVADGFEVIKGLGHQHSPRINDNDDDDEQQQQQQQQKGESEKLVSQTETASDADFPSRRNDDISDLEAYSKKMDRNSVGDSLKGSSSKGKLRQLSLEKPGVRFDELKLSEDEVTSQTSSIFGFRTSQRTGHFEYEDFDPATFSKWIGYSEETELNQILDTLEIEQLSVYAREMSQSASNPCVYGFAIESIRLASIEQLESMLEDARATAREANASLLLARSEMFEKVGASNVGLPTMEKASITKKDYENDSSDNTNAISHHEEKSGRKRDNRADNSTIITSRSREINNEEKSDNRSLKTSGVLRQRWKRRAKTHETKYNLAQDLMKHTSRHNIHSREDATGCCGRVKRDHLENPTYCVVTFTCRQAAVAARQCLADGKGIKAWEQIHNIPIYPLADAPPFNIFFCRGCCRPVALTIPESQKRPRKIIFWVTYVLFCFLYTIPISLVSSILDPQFLAGIFPDVPGLQDPDNFFFRMLAGISSGYVQTIFFSILPQVFKALAFFEGSSSSLAKAEENATQYYWFFMLITSFAGNSLYQMLRQMLFLPGNISNEVSDLLSMVAASTSTLLAPVWLNWIIVKTMNIFWIDLCQFLTFMFGFFRIHWLNRVARGGGPGTPAPYRKYIDSGVVFMCITSLSPACPLIAPAGLLYYMVTIPMLRWMHIFVYRPKYDGGGNLLPVIHDILISSLLLGQILLGAGLYLKESYVFGSVVMSMTIPTFLFSIWTKEKFMRPYGDAGLWQASKLDELSRKGTVEEREKYRRWLVDCHKASFVPICVAGGEDFLTYQPASVIPIDQNLLQRQWSSANIFTEANKKGII